MRTVRCDFFFFFIFQSLFSVICALSCMVEYFRKAAFSQQIPLTQIPLRTALDTMQWPQCTGNGLKIHYSSLNVWQCADKSTYRADGGSPSCEIYHYSASARKPYPTWTIAKGHTTSEYEITFKSSQFQTCMETFAASLFSGIQIKAVIG